MPVGAGYVGVQVPAGGSVAQPGSASTPGGCTWVVFTAGGEICEQRGFPKTPTLPGTPWGSPCPGRWQGTSSCPQAEGRQPGGRCDPCLQGVSQCRDVASLSPWLPVARGCLGAQL